MRRAFNGPPQPPRVSLTKFVAVYSDVQLVVTIESDNPLHKMLASEPRLLSGFKATAGLSDADWEEYKKNLAPSEAMQALRDCLSTVGLPTIPNLGDLGKEAEAWSVEWRLIRGMPHAFMSRDVNEFYLPGQWEMKLMRETDHSAAVMLMVDITEEHGKAHTGEVKKGKVVAEAALETAAPPSLGTWVNAMKGPLGLAQSVAELCAGWILEMFPPKAYGVLDVTYHEPSGGWSGTISYSWTKRSDNTRTLEYSRLPAHNRTVENYTETLTVNVSSSQLEIATGPEEVHVLNGDAQISYSDERVFETRADHECEPGSVITVGSTTERLTKAQWAGSIKARLTIQNGGGYQGYIDGLPEVTGTGQTRTQRIDRYGCETRTSVDNQSREQKVLAARWGTGFGGKLDLRQPGLIKGSHEATLRGGVVSVKAKWDLKRK